MKSYSICLSLTGFISLSINTLQVHHAVKKGKILKITCFLVGEYAATHGGVLPKTITPKSDRASPKLQEIGQKIMLNVTEGMQLT